MQHLFLIITNNEILTINLLEKHNLWLKFIFDIN